VNRGGYARTSECASRVRLVLGGTPRAHRALPLYFPFAEAINGTALPDSTGGTYNILARLCDDPPH
jgi:hypothetical protein